jgi:hypothetical protein
MAGIGRKRLGDTQQADLARIPQLLHRRHQLSNSVVVLVGMHAVQREYPYLYRSFLVHARYSLVVSNNLLKIGSDVLSFRLAPKGSH